MERMSGILLAATSLPGGTLGQGALAFLDFLSLAGQRLWQLLPVGPPACGDSPYSALSSFAGDPRLIDLEALVHDGLLTECELRSGRHRELLSLACGRLWEADRAGVEAFREQNPQLSDFALFMALRKHFGGRPWTEWEPGARLRRPDALARYREMLEEDIRRVLCEQLLFERQWKALRNRAREKGIRLMGDLPFYPAPDSADVWAERKFFLLDAEGQPTAVAGVPPDYFSETGQLWGNPLYDWQALERDGWGWWIRRFGAQAARFDAVRIDHFRAFESFWSVPAGAQDARAGHWEPGPGLRPVQVLREWFCGTDIIAEDLGEESGALHAFVEASGLPGMRVLQFGFDGGDRHLPHSYVKNCVCYTGTHDNDTSAGWFSSIPAEKRERAVRYLGLHGAEGPVRGMIRGVMSSCADWCVIPMQDWLGLGTKARMNVPGTPEGNWRWKLQPGEASAELAEEIRAMTKLYNR